jgi:hypothetical protein
MLLLSGILGGRKLRAEVEQSQDFEPADMVDRLEFTIEVGDGGEHLAEPVALDLGLGFPFWLHPLGSDHDGPLPVGATPQESPEQSALQPGESATFVFRREGDPGNDAFRHTPQLLDGVRISDIARLGIISKGTTDWELAAYRLVINGRLFAARDDVRQKARTKIEQAQLDWIESRDALRAFAEERSDLEALKQAGLATEEDLARLAEIEREARPVHERELWQQGIAAGALPWFVEEGLQIPGRDEVSEVASGRVILMTTPHTNAATHNYVYFQTGGKKYFLFPADNHFTPESNPQAFDLLLPAGPLAASDVRGFALGMLAHDRPYATAPDRWHPQRLVVELDGRSVYDSEEAAIDRQSLEAIRLIPPAHLDGNGNVQVNEPNPRECFAWTAGQAQGLDLENGGAVEVGGGVAGIEGEPPESAIAPDGAEGDPSGSMATGNREGVPSVAGPPVQVDHCWPGETPLEPVPWPDFPPDDFPSDGEDGVTRSEQPPWDGGSGGAHWDAVGGAGGNLLDAPPVSGWWNFGFGPDGGFWAGGGSVGGGMPWNGIPQDVLERFPDPNVDRAAWEAFVAWLSDLVDALLVALGPLPNDPVPIGGPPQIHNVRLLRNPDDPSLYQVVWDVSGDTGRITYCAVTLSHVKPETGQLLEKIVAVQRDAAADIGVSQVSVHQDHC